MESLTGRLLVATPALRDPNFERTVVLVVAHEEGGALGVVLNRATEVQVADVLGGWGALAGEPPVVFEGGPVQPEAAICLARTRPGVEDLAGFNRVSGAVGTVDLSGDPDLLVAGVVGVRVRRLRGLVPGPARARDRKRLLVRLRRPPQRRLRPRPDDLWQMVLRRQGGLMAAVAHYPADPTQN